MSTFVVANSQNRFLTGVATGIDGGYIIRIPANEENLTIIFSFVGMKSEKIEYTGQPAIDVVLGADKMVVDEVVVQGRQVDRMTGITEREQTASNATGKN